MMYTAIDDTVFDSKFECKEYELKLLLKTYLDEDSLEFFDDYDNPVKKLETIVDGRFVFGVRIRTAEALEYMKQLDEWTGMYQNIDDVGVWKYVIEDNLENEFWKKIAD